MQGLLSMKTEQADGNFSKDLLIILCLFSSPVTITDHVKPVCLPETSMMVERNAVCFLTAWRKTRGKAYSVRLKT